MQESDLEDGQDARLERGNALPVEKLAGNSIFGQRGLLLLRCGDGVAAPRLQPSGFTNTLRRIRFHDPFAMQLQGCADQSVQGRGPWLDARRRRIGKET